MDIYDILTEIAKIQTDIHCNLSDIDFEKVNQNIDYPHISNDLAKLYMSLIEKLDFVDDKEILKEIKVALTDFNKNHKNEKINNLLLMINSTSNRGEI